MKKITPKPVAKSEWEMLKGLMTGYTGVGYIDKGSLSFGVYVVKQAGTNQDRVLKVVQFENNNECNKTNQEMGNMGSLNHSSIVQFYHSVAQGQLLGIFMECLDGFQLEPHIRSRDFSQLEYCALFDKVLGAEHHAHQPNEKEKRKKGIVHLDLKPSNIIIVEKDGKEIPVLIDFGLSKAVGTDASSTIGGSLSYKAPECVWATNPVPTMDLFSTGIILYDVFSDAIKDAHVQKLHKISEAHASFGPTIKKYFTSHPGISKEDLEKKDPAFRDLIKQFKDAFETQIKSTYSPASLGGENSHLDRVIRHFIEFEPIKRYQSAETARIDLNLACRQKTVDQISVSLTDLINSAMPANATKSSNGIKFLANYRDALKECDAINSLEYISDSILVGNAHKKFRSWYSSDKAMRLDIKLSFDLENVNSVYDALKDAKNPDGTLKPDPTLKFLNTYKTLLGRYGVVDSLEVAADTILLGGAHVEFKKFRQQVARHICHCVYDRLPGTQTARQNAINSCLGKVQDEGDREMAKKYFAECEVGGRKPVADYKQVLDDWKEFFKKLPTPELSRLWDLV